MEISILTEFPKWEIPILVYQLFTKKINKNPYVKIYQTNSVTVSREESGPFHFDGESFPKEKEIKIEIIHNKLKIFK
jgi:diacylglycerol kinase family enzyme